MIGFIYQVGKDLIGIGKFIKEKFDWKEEIKFVDLQYIEKSGLQEKLENEGFHLRWSAFEKVESRKLDDWNYVYEIDEKNRTKYKLEVKDELVLMGLKK
ncbi:hypothetical protein ACFL2E_05035 [Thermodesulfobacteriota bacterium]